MIPQNLIHIGQMQGASISSARHNSAGKSDGGGFNSILNNIMNAGKNIHSGGNAFFPNKELDSGNKTGIIGLLRKFALGKGGNLKDMMVDENALADLKKFLLGAGFDKNSIENLFKNLKIKAGGRELSLSEVFQSLKGLKDNQLTDEKSDFLEISMVPFLEKALSSFGLNPSEISEALSGSKIEGVGIDLKALVSNLKNIQTRNPQFNNFQKLSGNSPVAPFNGSVEEFLNQSGLSEIFQKGKVTLDDFIKGLEGFVNRNEIGLSGVDVLNNDLRRFFDKVSIRKNSSEKSKTFGLNHESFKSDLINGENGKSGIFNHLMEKGQEEFQFNKENLLNVENFQKDGLASTFLKENQNSSPEILKNQNEFGKAFENLKAMPKKMEEGSLSLESLIRDINNPDKNIFISKEAPSPRNLPTYVLNQVGRQIFRSINSGDNEVKFQIRPPQLGRLQMTIDNSPDGFKISIIAEQNATKDLLLAQVNELKNLMMDQGIRIDSIDVNVSSNFQREMADARQQEENAKKRGRQGKDNPDELDQDGIIGGLQTGPLWYRAGVLDLVA